MTAALFDKLYPSIVERGMLEAYDRERRLMPILLDMERQGMRVDLGKLKKDVSDYGCEQILIDKWLKKELGDINFNSGAELIDAMVANHKVDTDLMPRTPKSNEISTAKESLLLGVTDKDLLAMLIYRAGLKACMDFMEPWLETANKSGGLIYTNWNQVRAEKGARTGRLSSNPNFQNIPKPMEVKNLPIKLPPLPKVREYIIPFEGDVLIDRDYSQQELRILAHFTEGTLLNMYKYDPWIDMHDEVKNDLEDMGLLYERGAVKNTNFGIIYGMGAAKLAAKNGSTVVEAKTLKDNILRMYPGIKGLYDDMRARARANVPFRTWGGREVYCEPDRVIDGTPRQFDYKMPNYLIQGSAADCTKEALILYYHHKHPTAKVILNVHDQITVSVPKELYGTEMLSLKLCMESIEFDVPMLSEGKISDKNWGSLINYDKKGEMV
jgi:DNA polymerase-1